MGKALWYVEDVVHRIQRYLVLLMGKTVKHGYDVESTDASCVFYFMKVCNALKQLLVKW